MSPLHLPLMHVVKRLELHHAWQALGLLQAGLWLWETQSGLRRDPACLALLGLEGESLDDLSWVDRVHPDDSAALIETLNGCFSGRLSSMHLEYRILHHDGHYVRVEERAQRIAEQQLLGVIRLCEPFHSRLDPEMEIDPLTGLDSRIRFEQRLATHLGESHEEAFCLLRFTVDHKAKILQLFGEADCDAMLAKLARLVRNELGGEEPFARWDEDSFILLLPGVERESALTMAEALRLTIADASLLPGRPVTVSCGLVQYQPGEQMDHLLARLAGCHGQARREFNSVVG
ncbi:diguanylate cyclase domain-containing protein [Aeromonas schubertii]